ncbi:MAG TPA: DUF1559 domain-containing protein [Planctomycetaceae bacterium]|nr:DUF1559 domain-containing protein [Planctomycetaceae bacterium]
MLARHQRRCGPCPGWPAFTRARGGMSLVELLTVMAIISLLAALLLPAVSAARERARMVQCANNLKQMGIAVLGFHADRGRFPTTGAPAAIPGTGDELMLTPRARDVSGAVLTGERKTWSWAWDLLPYLERENLYRTKDDEFVRGRTV